MKTKIHFIKFWVGDDLLEFIVDVECSLSVSELQLSCAGKASRSANTSLRPEEAYLLMTYICLPVCPSTRPASHLPQRAPWSVWGLCLPPGLRGGV